MTGDMLSFHSLTSSVFMLALRQASAGNTESQTIVSMILMASRKEVGDHPGMVLKCELMSS